MERSCSNYLQAKIPPILTIFNLFFLQTLAFVVSADSPSLYTPTENILLACGSSGSLDSQHPGQRWIGDIDSPYFLPSFEPQNNASSISALPQQAISISEKFYLKARLSYSRFTYIFNVTAGPKFIRLYFYPTSYPNFDSSKAFFSVTTGSFTLLSNFSGGSRRDNALGQDTVFKEFCINVQEGQSLNITFTPSPDHQDAYAFVNAIEIFSMPQDLYYTPHKPIEFVGQVDRYSIGNRNILETVYRINVGGAFIPPQDDTGMYRTWTGAYTDYLTYSIPGSVPVNLTIDLGFSMIPSYTAPVILYQTAMTMGSLAWQFPVDAGFTYVVRLHFCEFQRKIKEVGDRVFEIYIASILAETEADVIRWSGGNGIPIDRDYAVLIGQKGNENKKNLSITLNPAPGYSEAILNGLEIFKVDNNGNLAGSNPDITPLPKKKSSHAIIVSIISCVASSFVLFFLLNLFLFRRKRKAKASVSGTGISLGPFSSPMTKSSKASGSSQPSDHKLYGYFSLAEIKAATNNFDQILVIGVGGFGNVYKGWFINNEVTPVAVKRLNPGSQQGAREFKTEIEMLSQLRHRHLVSLIGYCNDDGEMILVYDYMARGTLRDHLYNGDNPPLPWNRRLQICIGAARGLHYLHTGAKHIIIHRDVKTTNILLDEKWVAKVSDFGLSKIGATTFSQTHISTMVKGTFGYLDPDYFLLQQLTEKSDVYSFGVVLFEVLCARPPVLRTEDRKRASLAVWARECHNNGVLDQIVDPFLKGNIAPECLNQFAEVAISCLDEDRNSRPSMSEVVYCLEIALRLQNSKEKDHHEIEEADQIASHCIDKGKIPLESYSTDDTGVVFSNLDW